MRKDVFLTVLRRKLSGLPKREVEERLAFYNEMIDDRIEEGQTEEEAVSGVGSVNEIASQIIADIPFLKIAKEKIKPKRSLKGLEIALLAVGSPIWFSLLVAIAAVVFSLYAVLWSLAIAAWAVFVSLGAAGIACLPAAVVFAIGGNGLSGLFLFGGGCAAIGVAIFAYFGSVYATKGVVILSKKIILDIKKCFVKKEINNA